ncbi:MAG: hypothetical protein SOW22_01330 [Candidatus Egerieousia sp.]|nr:hypothetical protein [Candidatus Egerieousia sp.]
MKRELEELDIRELDAIVCSAPWFTYARYLLLCKLAALGRESFLSGVRTSLISLPDRERLISKIAAMYGLVKVAKSISAAPSAKGSAQGIAAAAGIKAASGIAAASGAEAASGIAAASGIEAASGVTGSRDGSLSGKEALSFGLLDVEFIEGGAFERHPYVVGGDYFSKADIDSLENKQENISLNYLKGAGSATSGGAAMQGSGATPGSAAMQGSGSAAEGSATPGSGAVAEGGAIAKDESSGEISLEIDSPLCTETLASIYAQQGYYQQAIEIYSKLCLLYPEKSAYFATLVKEVKIKKTE